MGSNPEERLLYSKQQAQWCLERGIEAFKFDNPLRARLLFEMATQHDPHDPKAWEWLLKVTEEPELRIRYYERLLRADPYNIKAQQALDIARGLLKPEEMLPAGAAPAVPSAAIPAAAGVRLFLCQRCGGTLFYDDDAGGLHCERCGGIFPVDAPNAADDEHRLGLVLPTIKAHLWAEAHHLVSCSQCGAKSLVPPGNLTMACPFCGSTAVVQVAEGAPLLAPHAITPMAVSPDEAGRAAEAWLQAMYGAQVSEVGGLQLRAAFYPFWTFDGHYEMSPRSAQGLMGGRSAPGDDGPWIFRYDDLLVPASSQLAHELLATVLPFRLKAVVAYRPEFLAGWPALLYDRSLADASIMARGQIVEQAQHHFRKSLHQMRGDFSEQRYKLVLLPLWVGQYRYRQATYPLMVNGQTEQVGGLVAGDPAPRDQSLGRRLRRLWEF